MPVFTSSIEVTADYPTIKPSLNLNFARARALDPRITFTRASTATYIGRDGLVKYAGEDEPRFDHDPETGESLGLLIEESRTNYFPFSASTSLFNTVVTTPAPSQGFTAPDGSTDAYQYPINSTDRLQSNRTVPAGQTHTLSFFAKQGDGTNLSGSNGINNGGQRDSNGSIYNWTTGVLQSGWAKEDYANGWSRFSKSYTSTTSTLFVLNISSSEGVLLWGFQLEINTSFPTSYIPTSGAAVTRAADRARITGTPFSDFFNTTEGTLVVQGRTSAGNSSQFTNQPIISIHNGSTTNRIIMFDRDGGTLEWNVVDGTSANGSGLLLDETTSYSGAADYIMCGTYENGAPTRAVANGLGADGTTVESSGKNDTVNVFNQMDIGNELGTRQCSSPIKQVRYYPLSLSDAQIKSLVQ